MLANFFSLGSRNYLNNAVVIADLLEVLKNHFGSRITDLKVKFKKPLNVQGDLHFDSQPVQGSILGSFQSNDLTVFFGYEPTDIPLQPRSETNQYFNVCWAITDACRGVIEAGFERAYGPMSTDDKVIFAIFEVPDVDVLQELIDSNTIPTFDISEAVRTGERRFSTTVSVNGKLLGIRHSTVGKFSV